MVENAKQRLTDAKIGEKEKKDSAQKSLFNQCQLFFLPSATRPGEDFIIHLLNLTRKDLKEGCAESVKSKKNGENCSRK